MAIAVDVEQDLVRSAAEESTLEEADHSPPTLVHPELSISQQKSSFQTRIEPVFAIA